MIKPAAYTYRLTEEGDLYLGGAIPEYESPELYPHYVHRDSVLRVIALPGTRVPKRALSGYPDLRVALLSDAVSIACEAFFDCPSLAAIQLSARTVSVAPDAFSACPRLFCIDYVGTRDELDFTMREVLLPLEYMVIRTLPDPKETVAEGKLGTAEWALSEDGVLTVFGGDVPDLGRLSRSPFHAVLESIRHVVIGEGVGRVGKRAFYGLPALRALSVVGDTEIAPFAFASCHQLTSIDLFCATSRLGLCALAGVGVRELMLPPSLRRIPDGLLQSAYALQTLVLPLLPAVAEAPFLDHCSALATVKLLAAEADERALGAALFLPKQVKVACYDPATDRKAEAYEAFLDAERAIRTAAASYGVARQAQDIARSHVEAIAPLIDAAEREHLILERARFAPDIRENITLHERMPFKKRAKLMKQREKERKEELGETEKRTEQSYRRLTEKLDAFYNDLKSAADACKQEAADLEAAKKQIADAEATVDGLFPLDGMHRARAAALHEGIAGFTAALPPDIMPNALLAVSEYKMLVEFHRFADLRDSLSRAVLLLDECRTPDADPKKGEPRVPPCILVAGGDPETDRSTAACIDALRRAGAIVDFVKPDARTWDDVSYDALLLCDGEAQQTAYGGFFHGLRLDDVRARRDSTLFSAFFLYGKPIMGIGRGAQQINLYLAGTMRWNLNHDERDVHAAREDGKPRVHSITVAPDNALSEMYGLGELPLRVLSDHTSAIRTLGRELVPIAKAKDGVIEAFVHRRVPLIGVQFALDRMLSEAPRGFVYPAPAVDDGMTLFSAFVDLACRVREHPPVLGTADRYSDKKKKRK